MGLRFETVVPQARDLFDQSPTSYGHIVSTPAAIYHRLLADLLASSRTNHDVQPHSIGFKCSLHSLEVDLYISLVNFCETPAPSEAVDSQEFHTVREHKSLKRTSQRLLSSPMEGKAHSRETYRAAGQASWMEEDLVRCSENSKHSYKQRPATRKQWRQPDDTKQRPNVCMVGAGLEGLRCAEILIEKGVTVTILEARDRIGGRVSPTSAISKEPRAYTDFRFLKVIFLVVRLICKWRSRQRTVLGLSLTPTTSEMTLNSEQGVQIGFTEPLQIRL